MARALDARLFFPAIQILENKGNPQKVPRKETGG